MNTHPGEHLGYQCAISQKSCREANTEAPDHMDSLQAKMGGCRKQVSVCRVNRSESVVANAY